MVSALLTESVEAMRPTHLLCILRMQRHLQIAGFELNLHFDLRCRWQKPQRRLEALVNQTHAACWVLFSVDAAVQQWFMDHRIPSIVDGTLHKGIQMPSIDVHHEAICRHAAGKFLSMGHREVVLLIPNSGLAGDLASERGFLDAFKQSPHTDTNARIVHHGGTAGAVRTILDSLFRSKKRPSGILVSDSGNALTVVGHLISQGMRLPQDISVICRDHDPFLSELVPTVACYEVNQTSYANRLSRLVVELARNRVLPVRTVWSMARFRDGDTFGPKKVG